MGFSDLERSLGIATMDSCKQLPRGSSFSDLERSLGIATEYRLDDNTLVVEFQ